MPAGTKRERGLLKWNKADPEDSACTLETEEVYDLPFGITSFLSSRSWARYIPFCPWKGHTFQPKTEDNNMLEIQGQQQSPARSSDGSVVWGLN